MVAVSAKRAAPRCPKCNASLRDWRYEASLTGDAILDHLLDYHPQDEASMLAREAELKKTIGRDTSSPRAVGIFGEALAACICPRGLPPLVDCPIHGDA